MFGNMIANMNDLNDEEKERYGSLYCGLCHTLKKRYGNSSRMSLSFDLTFFVLLLNSLYEPQEESSQMGCLMHPVPKTIAVSTFTDYAADLSVLLTYHKCLDDWHDERKKSSKVFSLALQKAYNNAVELRPVQAASIENAMRDIRGIENDDNSSLDAAAQVFGELLGFLLLCRRDHWSELLFRFGYELGRFIYVLDAALDLEDDRKSGSYNPFIAAETDSSHIFIMLNTLVGNAAQAMEKLPLVQDAHLLRSVIYAGVWQRYNSTAADSDALRHKTGGEIEHTGQLAQPTPDTPASLKRHIHG